MASDDYAAAALGGKVSPSPSELDQVVRSKKAKVAWSVTVFTAVEVVICIMSIDRLARTQHILPTSSETIAISGDNKEKNTSILDEESEEDDIDSGIIEVVLFAQPFMLVTNLLVILAIIRDLERMSDRLTW